MISPAEQDYLEQLERALSWTSLGEKERADILLEVRNHLGESRASGLNLDEVIRRFGNAQDLANTYAAELLGNTPGPAGKAGQMLLAQTQRAVAALSGGLVTLILGIAGTSLLAGGAAVFLYAVAGPWLPPIQDGLVLRAGIPQAVLAALGLLAASIGTVTLRATRINFRIFTNLFRTKRDKQGE